jgi:hypothetical protein
MSDKLYNVAMWFGRKFLALFLCLIALVLSGIFAPEKLSSISLAIVGLYTAFVGGHSATDIMNHDKNDKTTTDVKLTKTDVIVKKEEKSVDAD